VGNKGTIEDTRYKVHGVFDWVVKGVEALVKTRMLDRKKYLAQNMMGVKDDRLKKGQISFAHKITNSMTSFIL